MKTILARHINKYPGMLFADMIKLIYQNEFGGGHIVSDEVKNLERLKYEYEDIKRQDTSNRIRSLFEDIGNSQTRLDIICAIDAGCAFETVGRLHKITADSHKGKSLRFKSKLLSFAEMCNDGLFPFDGDDVMKFVDGYDFDHYSPIGHSKAYKEKYCPAYRIIKKAYADYFELYIKIDKMLRQKDKVTVAIDGRCASGKTTLARMLKNLYDCNIFHADDFFLRPEQRTEKRLSEPGGNFDFERFYEEIINGISKGSGFSYRPFDCEVMALSDEIKVKKKKLNIIEGAYCMHPGTGDVYDIRVFVDIKKNAQIKRIIKRNAPILHDRFFNEWIPMEETYIEMMDIKSKCDIVFDSIKGFI